MPDSIRPVSKSKASADVASVVKLNIPSSCENDRRAAHYQGVLRFICNASSTDASDSDGTKEFGASDPGVTVILKRRRVCRCFGLVLHSKIDTECSLVFYCFGASGALLRTCTGCGPLPLLEQL